MEERTYNKEERFDARTIEALKLHYTEILRRLGEDPTREGLLKTPERIAKAMSFLTKGYEENPLEIIRSATFREEYKQMVLVKDIELYSLCEHHMLPFYGKAHVAYIPNGHITGLSKIARVVECYARRLQVQERLTVQIRDCIQEALNPMGVAVVIEASHMCMQMRGIEKQQSATTTSAFTGIFLSDHRTREEFMTLISHKYRQESAPDGIKIPAASGGTNEKSNDSRGYGSPTVTSTVCCILHKTFICLSLHIPAVGRTIRSSLGDGIPRRDSNSFVYREYQSPKQRRNSHLRRNSPANSDRSKALPIRRSVLKSTEGIMKRLRGFCTKAHLRV